jgi:hypothetical protein
MPHPPKGYNICPCCGIEFGLDDAFEGYEELRNQWLAAGGSWFSQVHPYIQPVNWDAWKQLDSAGYPYRVPRPTTVIILQYHQGILSEQSRLLGITAPWMQSGTSAKPVLRLRHEPNFKAHVQTYRRSIGPKQPPDVSDATSQVSIGRFGTRLAVQGFPA